MGKKSWPKFLESEDLDMSAGPQYCNKCDYHAEDGYDLDGHFWSEHDDDDEYDSKSCNFCDKKSPALKDLMIHKKQKHIEKVSFCWNFPTNTCIHGDEKCWFVHEPEPEPKAFDDFDCNLCDKEFKLQSEFLKHRKMNHEDKVPACKNFKAGNCVFGNEHKNNIKEKFENDEVVQKIFKMMEKMTKRITDIEKTNLK